MPKFTCKKCQNECITPEGDDEIAEAEFRKNYPGADLRDSITLCETCYDEYIAWMISKGKQLPESLKN